MLKWLTDHPCEAVLTGHSDLLCRGRRGESESVAQSSLSPRGRDRFFNSEEQSAAEEHGRLSNPLKTKRLGEGRCSIRAF